MKRCFRFWWRWNICIARTSSTVIWNRRTYCYRPTPSSLKWNSAISDSPASSERNLSVAPSSALLLISVRTFLSIQSYSFPNYCRCWFSWKLIQVNLMAMWLIFSSGSAAQQGLQSISGYVERWGDHLCQSEWNVSVQRRRGHQRPDSKRRVYVPAQSLERNLFWRSFISILHSLFYYFQSNIVSAELNA